VTITSNTLTICTVASTMPVLGSPALQGSPSKLAVNGSLSILTVQGSPSKLAVNGSLSILTVHGSPSKLAVNGSLSILTVHGSPSKPEFKIGLRTSSSGESFSTSFEGIPSILAV
jgi:hypothetical protein